MDRRSIFGGLIALIATPIAAKAATAKKCFNQDQNSVEWRVPKNITKIRVRSWSKERKEVIDTHFSVREGQVFRIDVVD